MFWFSAVRDQVAQKAKFSAKLGRAEDRYPCQQVCTVANVNVIVTPEDLLKAQHVKTDKVGFAKLFGSANMDSVYAHIARFRSQQIRDGAGGKWLKELKAPKEIMAKWRLSFYDRCKLIKRSS
ncbi:hypothetical protein BV898_18901 [Hypsibius exemplaris]|uniref:Uncharacterized protein n=1 Tax=Hypsibius exemplaris TaxID=2072580 RepID=A0A9X6RPA1_HYPEX|nr:hypothetical protein BV898_18901 [Hypsibius exemplaris]